MGKSRRIFHREQRAKGPGGGNEGGLSKKGMRPSLLTELEKPHTPSKPPHLCFFRSLSESAMILLSPLFTGLLSTCPRTIYALSIRALSCSALRPQCLAHT